MEKDTVLISIETYNNLRDFRKKMEDENSLFFYNGLGGLYNRMSVVYVSKDKALKDAQNINSILLSRFESETELKQKIADENQKLLNYIEQIKNGKLEKADISFTNDEFKKLTIFKFLKFRKKIRKGI